MRIKGSHAPFVYRYRIYHVPSSDPPDLFRISELREKTKRIEERKRRIVWSLQGFSLGHKQVTSTSWINTVCVCTDYKIFLKWLLFILLFFSLKTKALRVIVHCLSPYLPKGIGFSKTKTWQQAELLWWRTVTSVLTSSSILSQQQHLLCY